MNTFINALKTNSTRTENNMTTHSSSLNALVDFFGMAGSARNMSGADVENYFIKALHQNPDHAMKLLFWARDVRGGAGERRLFKIGLIYLANCRPEFLENNIQYIPEYGRWDDLLVLFGTQLENAALKLIVAALKDGNSLCAKWMPRKGPKANKLRAYMQLTPKEYRKTLVGLTHVVETLMCANEFEAIDYSKLPSLASARYQKAFERHDAGGYAKYLEGLISGETKINAGAVYPYDVVKSLDKGNEVAANAQWAALPDYMEGSEGRTILPVVDTSGSMCCSAGGSSATCLDVAVSLGLYLSERNRGIFKDHFITFSANPKLQHLVGDLRARYNQLSRAEWQMNTNIQAVFVLILGQAVRNSVPQEDMPDQILILSDMQFDQCTGTGRWGSTRSEYNPNVLELIKSQYAQAGYDVPELVFWHLNAKPGQSPVQVNDTGTALVSGFSPAIMKAILSASEIESKDFSPETVMMEVVNSERYEVIKA